jgi:hypothetical protein
MFGLGSMSDWGSQEEFGELHIAGRDFEDPTVGLFVLGITSSNDLKKTCCIGGGPSFYILQFHFVSRVLPEWVQSLNAQRVEGLFSLSVISSTMIFSSFVIIQTVITLLRP